MLFRALAGVTHYVGALSHNQKVVGLIPSLGTYLDCRVYPWSRCLWEVTNWCFFLASMSLSLCLSVSLSLSLYLPSYLTVCLKKNSTELFSGEDKVFFFFFKVILFREMDPGHLCKWWGLHRTWSWLRSAQNYGPTTVQGQPVNMGSMLATKVLFRIPIQWQGSFLTSLLSLPWNLRLCHGKFNPQTPAESIPGRKSVACIYHLYNA